MDLEYVSVEKSRYHEEYYRPESNKSTTFSRKEARSVCDHEVSRREIDRVLGEISDKGLCGHEHVREYLHEQYCRNCRPSTIRGNGTAIILFLSFFKATTFCYSIALDIHSTATTKRNFVKAIFIIYLFDYYSIFTSETEMFSCIIVFLKLHSCLPLIFFSFLVLF